METVDFIIYARWIIPVLPRNTVLSEHCVVIHQGRIQAILPQNKAKAHYLALSEQYFNDHCITPGLVNNHTHAAMSLLRGLADDRPLMTWLNDHIWPAEAKWVSEGFVEAGSKLAIAEMLRGGTTCFNDMYFFADVTARVVEQSGIRANLGMIVIEFPSAWAEDAADYLRKGEQLHDRYSHHTRLTTSYAPHAPYTVSNESLTSIITNAEELDVPIHMHIHETSDEVAQSVAQYGMRPLERLRGLGLLSPRLTAVHMTQLTDEEIDWCAASGVHIAHCPTSNLKLASGFAPIAKLTKKGVNITIGTDGAASNNGLDMFAEMKQTASLAKAVAQDASVIPAHLALEMATINAAKSLGLDDEIGSIEVGKSADLIAVYLGEIETQPCYDVISQLVYATGRDKVTDVWVEGKALLKDRQLTTLNRHNIIQTAQEWAVKIRQTA
ncbi:MAG: 5-methylthioadenosine/S-adenosylhomocysteine deaminase [Methylophagaceae bacterium]|jgi:5-methylthioadenosine/S-adenosylhomocysteine deaminase